MNGYQHEIRRGDSLTGVSLQRGIPCHVFAIATIFCCLLLALPATAKSQSDDVLEPVTGPHQMIQEITQEILDIIRDADRHSAYGQQRALEDIERVLEQVVDFDAIARSVMGSYASRRYFESLSSDAERHGYSAQAARFREVFKRRMIDTYGKGMLALGQQQPVLVPAHQEATPGPYVTVRQQIVGTVGRPILIQYRLRQDRNGNWKLRNLSMDGVNLGKVYRHQFASAMHRHEGDLDRVVQAWAGAD